MSQPEQYNVLLVTADQFRGDFLGCAGHPVVRTPNLDALGVAGAYFPRAFSPVPVCVPARYAIMTGRVPIAFGVRGNGGRIPPDAVTLPAAFGHAGYATAAIGKMHFSPWREPYGFKTFVVSEEGRQWQDPAGGDDYQRYLRDVGWGGYERAHGIGNNDVHTSTSPLPLEHYHTTWATRTTQRWLRDHVSRAGATGQPFFAWCSYTKPHSPYDPPEPYDRLYDPRTFPPPIGSAEDIRDLSPRYQEERNGHLWDTLGPETIQRARAFYAGNVTLIDRMVGELRQTLAQLGVAERTVICFTADHGDLLGDHGLFFKANYFTGAWQVPFLLYAPARCDAVGVAERFVSTEDVYPTLLSLAGVPLPDGHVLHGRTVHDDPNGGPPAVFGSIGRPPQQIHSARTRRWSYVLHARGAYEELYDLAADAGERHNLAEGAGAARSGEAAGAMADLRAQLETWLAAVGDRESLDASGRVLTDPDARGWEPSPPPRTRLGLRPY
jgi:arylsulfatase A-like enzyme